MSDIAAMQRTWQRLADNETLAITVGNAGTPQTGIIPNARLGEHLRALLMDDLARQITAAETAAIAAEG